MLEYYDYNGNENALKMYNIGFRYGIIESDSIDEDIDFNDKNSYIDTNFFMDDTGLDLDKNDLYLYRIVASMRKGSSTSSGSQVDYIGLYSDYNGESNTSQTTDGSAQEIWTGLYADAVCYDEVGGIFYYRADDNYYPVQKVAFYFNYYVYVYSYDFEVGKYKLYSSNYTSDMVNTYNFIDSDFIEYALSCKGSDGYFTFNTLYNYGFGSEMWGTILMDNVRYIEGNELTTIYSTVIPDSHFIKNSDYYLDENYTLQVKQISDDITKTYWVFSIIPSDVTPKFSGNDYEQSLWFLSLFYELRIICIVLLVVGVIVGILSLIYLICDAGYRKGSDAIQLMKFPDYIPFDLWSVVVFAAGVLMLAGVIVTFDRVVSTALSYITLSTPVTVALMIITPLGIMAISALCLWYVLGFAVRVKNGKWWQNTLCYKVCKLLKKIIIKFFQNIGLLWKFIVIISLLAVIRYVIYWIFDSSFLLMVSGVIARSIEYIIVIYLIIQFGELLKASRKLADGDLSYKVDTSKMLFEFAEHGENLNKISEGMSKTVEERMKSERFKTELIANVSHDIKTPLTSIINYVDLLEKEELNNEKASEYLEVLERQSSKLKKLIEDLIEASKASSGNLTVNYEKLDLGVFITQTVGEFEEKLNVSGLELIIRKPDKPVYIMADGRHLWRVVDNLMNNICKYAQNQSRVYVNLEADNDNVQIKFMNISKYQLNVTGEELMERFVRGDKSRNTEGHGLGLSIALSLVNLMGGKMEIVVDGDLFKVILSFKKEAPDMIEVSDKNKI
jgi:signal transduction histidine kinase